MDGLTILRSNGGTGGGPGAPSRGLFRVRWLISGFWVLVLLVTALQDWLLQGADFMATLRFGAAQWLPWTFLTPAIVWLSAAFTLERGQWQKRLAVHLVVCAAVTIILGVLSYWARPPPFARQSRRETAGPPRPQPSLVEIILRRAPFQFPIYSAIVGIAHTFVFYERSRERERHAAILESRLTRSGLQTLQMQLNPHFLFNTLNSIASLIHENPRVADEMVGSLSEFLRLTLKTSDRSEVTLREELDFPDHYLAIEEVRFGARLRVEKQVEPAALNALVPVLILQPLVENAIKHGVEKQVAPVLVRITAKCRGGSLLLQVVDNGRGFKDLASGKFAEGVGLSNTRARLQELAGAAASLQFNTPPEGGLVVEILIPWRSAPTDEAPDSSNQRR